MDEPDHATRAEFGTEAVRDQLSDYGTANRCSRVHVNAAFAAHDLERTSSLFTPKRSPGTELSKSER